MKQYQYQYWLKVKGSDELYNAYILHFKQHWFEESNNISLLFSIVGSDDIYTYSWLSTPSLGLSTLTLKGETVYDPYNPKNESKYVALHEIGRQLSILFRQKSVTKEPVETF